MQQSVRVTHKAEAQVTGDTLTKDMMLAILDNANIPGNAQLTIRINEGQRGGVEAITVLATW